MKKLIKKNKEIKNIYKLFKPELTPKKMLEMGIFGGSYFGLNIKEFPTSWFKSVKISTSFDVSLNRFKIIAEKDKDKQFYNGLTILTDKILLLSDEMMCNSSYS